MAGIDRAITEREKQGFLKIIFNKKHKIIGATLICENAGETIPLISLAINKDFHLVPLQILCFLIPQNLRFINLLLISF